MFEMGAHANCAGYLRSNVTLVALWWENAATSPSASKAQDAADLAGVYKVTDGTQGGTVRPRVRGSAD
jgi:hypothetical protein